MSEFVHLDDEVLLSGRIIRFVRGRFSTPSGETLEREVIRHPGAVSAVAVESGRVLLVEQYRAPVNRWVLEIPAGLRDVPGEPPEETARRELAEEIGREPGTLELLVQYMTAPGFTDEEVWIYLAEQLTPVPTAPHGPEEEAMRVVALDEVEIREGLEQGRFVDGKTIIALSTWLRRLPS